MLTDENEQIELNVYMSIKTLRSFSHLKGFFFSTYHALLVIDKIAFNSHQSK